MLWSNRLVRSAFKGRSQAHGRRNLIRIVKDTGRLPSYSGTAPLRRCTISPMAYADSVPVDVQRLSLRQTIDYAPARIHVGRPAEHHRFLQSNMAQVRRAAASGFAGLEVDNAHPSRGERGL